MARDPEEFKNDPHEQKKTPLQWVRELCGMQVYSINTEKPIPLIGALKENLVPILDSLNYLPPEELQEQRDMYQRLQDIIRALEIYMSGKGAPQDAQVIIESPSIFQAFASELYDRVEQGIDIEGIDPTIGQIFGISEEDENNDLREAQDWKNVASKADQVATALKSQIDMGGV